MRQKSFFLFFFLNGVVSVIFLGGGLCFLGKYEVDKHKDESLQEVGTIYF